MVDGKVALVAVSMILLLATGCATQSDVQTGSIAPSSADSVGMCAPGAVMPSGEYYTPPIYEPNAGYAVLRSIEPSSSATPQGKVADRAIKVTLSTILRPAMKVSLESDKGTESVIWGGLADRIESERSAGAVAIYLGVLPFADGRPVVVDAVALRKDGSAVFLGSCQAPQSKRLSDSAKASGVSQHEMALSLAKYDRLSASTTSQPDWDRRSADERQVDGSTPGSVLSRLDEIKVVVNVPKEWLDNTASLCAKTSVAYGTCVRLANNMGPKIELTGYFERQGPTPRALQLVIRDDAGGRRTIASVPADKAPVLTLGGGRGGEVGVRLDSEGGGPVPVAPQGPTPPTSVSASSTIAK